MKTPGIAENLNAERLSEQVKDASVVCAAIFVAVVVAVLVCCSIVEQIVLVLYEYTHIPGVAEMMDLLSHMESRAVRGRAADGSLNKSTISA